MGFPRQTNSPPPPPKKTEDKIVKEKIKPPKKATVKKESVERDLEAIILLSQAKGQLDHLAKYKSLHHRCLIGKELQDLSERITLYLDTKK